MMGIASGSVRTTRPDWRRRFSAKCGLSSAPLEAERSRRDRQAGPLDLRRSCARLCHFAGGELDQIQFLLGHVHPDDRALAWMQAEASDRRETTDWESNQWFGTTARPDASIRAGQGYGHAAWYVERDDPPDRAQFFTTDLPATLAYYRDTLGFECLGTWNDPPVYAIVARDEQRIHFRLADPPTPNPDKYADELLDAYLFIQNPDALYAEYAARGVEFTRALANTPWDSREFVVKDCDGRLLAFGGNPE
jgi:uncharacterized glyoxalase superfamily protein PhnB